MRPGLITQVSKSYSEVYCVVRVELLSLPAAPPMAPGNLLVVAMVVGCGVVGWRKQT